jgi:hypothetical protein
MMGGGDVGPLKVGRRRPKSPKQAEASLAILQKILPIAVRGAPDRVRPGRHLTVNFWNEARPGSIGRRGSAAVARAVAAPGPENPPDQA